jgi:diacylglycerol kinase family enzyme
MASQESDRGDAVANGKASAATAAQHLRVLLVVNPHATSTDDRVRRAVAGALARRHAVEVVETRHKGHGLEISRAAADQDFDVVVALGGDGTINEVANGLAGTRTALAPLPGGATNVYCRMLGVPRRVPDALDRLAASAWSGVGTDVARLNDRWFTFSAGIGLDASAVQKVDRRPWAKARWGPWFFAGVGLSVFLGGYVRDPVRMEVIGADGAQPAVTVLMQNGNPYTYFGDRPIVLVEDAGLFAGDLAGVALTRARMRDLVPVLWRALSGRRPVGEHPAVSTLSTGDGLIVRSLDHRALPMQVDGDHIGEGREARFSVLAGGLRVVTGADRSRSA